MRAEVYLLTILKDDAGNVIAETRAPVPALSVGTAQAFAQTAASDGETDASPRTPQPRTVFRSDLDQDAGRYEEDGEEEDDLPPLPSGAIPLYETDREVLSVMGREAFAVRDQTQRVIPDSIRNGGDPRERLSGRATGDELRPGGKHARPLRGRMSGLATDASPANMMG